jgi:hypothetical protein
MSTIMILDTPSCESADDVSDRTESSYIYRSGAFS